MRHKEQHKLLAVIGSADISFDLREKKLFARISRQASASIARAKAI